jgi:hypothetical protein
MYLKKGRKYQVVIKLVYIGLTLIIVYLLSILYLIRGEEISSRNSGLMIAHAGIGFRFFAFFIDIILLFVIANMTDLICSKN